jgi:hypothetical protein
VNIWAISHDPNTWKKLLEFNLDQFSSSKINVEELDLGQIMVQLGLAKVLHAFDWSLQPNISSKKT